MRCSSSDVEFTEQASHKFAIAVEKCDWFGKRLDLGLAFRIVDGGPEHYQSLIPILLHLSPSKGISWRQGTHHVGQKFRSTVRQPSLAAFSAFCIHSGNLLHARVIIDSYD